MQQKIRLLNSTADDIMSRELVCIPHKMRLRDAARLLLQNQIGGAPVVNERGECVGVLSAFDFMRFAERGMTPEKTMPKSCSFQTKRRTAQGKEVTVCTLAPGVCSIQGKHTEPGGEELLVCREPHCVLADWQVVEVEKLPVDDVLHFMNTDPVTAESNTPIRDLARNMIDAHIHRIIVVDGARRPIGIVSSTDILAAVAYAESAVEEAIA